MNKRPVTIVGAVILIALLGIGGRWWFFDNYEQKSREVFTGLRGEARVNPLLAAERFVRASADGNRMVTEARSLAQVSALDDGEVLILSRYRAGFSPAQIESLVAWVERGGLLITEPANAAGDDPLFDALAIERDRSEAQVEDPISTVKLPWGSDASYRVRFEGRTTVDYYGAPQPAFAVDDSSGRRLVAFTLGEGKVIAMGSLGPFENQVTKTTDRTLSIGFADHAAFLMALLGWQDDDEANVNIYARATRPSAWAWLKANAPFALAALAMFIMLWLWHIAIRFGPIAPDPLPVRRRLSDHLLATGRFLWRRKAASPLTESARALALRRMTRLVPEFPALDPTAQASALVAQIGLSRNEARTVLAGGAANAPDFVALMRLLHRIHVATGRPQR